MDPGWHHDGDAEAVIKIVMKGSAEDSGEWQLHIREKTSQEAQSPRFKDPHDPLRMVLIRNIWLTNFGLLWPKRPAT